MAQDIEKDTTLDEAEINTVASDETPNDAGVVDNSAVIDDVDTSIEDTNVTEQEEISEEFENPVVSNNKSNDEVAHTTQSDPMEPDTSISDEIENNTLNAGNIVYDCICGIPLYKDASRASIELNNYISYVRGTLYAWSNDICNGRIPVTNDIHGAGEPDKLLGWVNVSDLK